MCFWMLQQVRRKTQPSEASCGGELRTFSCPYTCWVCFKSHGRKEGDNVWHVDDGQGPTLSFRWAWDGTFRAMSLMYIGKDGVESISFSGRHTTRQANKLSQCGESPVSKSGYVQRSKSCKGRRWTVTPTRTVEDISCLWKAHNWQSYHRRAPHWLFDVNLPARMLKARLHQGSLHSVVVGPPPNCGTPEQKSLKVIENHKISLKLDCSSLPQSDNVSFFRTSLQLIENHWISSNCP